jgi:hypothetical protein
MLDGEHVVDADGEHGVVADRHPSPPDAPHRRDHHGTSAATTANATSRDHERGSAPPTRFIA